MKNLFIETLIFFSLTRDLLVRVMEFSTLFTLCLFLLPNFVMWSIKKSVV